MTKQQFESWLSNQQRKSAMRSKNPPPPPDEPSITPCHPDWAILHDIKSPITCILLKLDLIERIEDRNQIPEVRQCLAQIRQNSRYISERLDRVLQPTGIENRLEDAHILQILAIMEIMLKQAQSYDVSTETHAYLEQIQQTGLRVKGMLETLLQSTAERNHREDKQLVEIAPIIRMILDDFNLQIQDQGITVAISSDLPPVIGEPSQVTTIFANLIGNAIKYIGKHNANPHIDIVASYANGQVRYEVQDNGVGIKPEDQACIFEPHTRFHHDQALGTGLGLPIVRSAVVESGGCVGVESVPGRGSTFWFTLPAAAPN